MLRPAHSLAAFFLLGACSPAPQPIPVSDALSEAVDSTVVVDAEGNLLATVLDGAQAITAGQAALNVEANAEARFSPSGCVTGTVDGATVTLVYAKCNGPRGLAGVEGTLTMSLLVSDTTIQADAKASQLLMNETWLDIASTATYAVDPATGVPSLDVTASGDGAGPFLFADSPNSVGHVGAYSLTWTPACRTLSGNWSWSVGVDHVVTTDLAVSKLVRCDQSCPAGGSVEAYGNANMFTIAFDGTAAPPYTTVGTKPAGRAALVGCTAASSQASHSP